MPSSEVIVFSSISKRSVTILLAGGMRASSACKTSGLSVKIAFRMTRATMLTWLIISLAAIVFGNLSFTMSSMSVLSALTLVKAIAEMTINKMTMNENPRPSRMPIFRLLNIFWSPVNGYSFLLGSSMLRWLLRGGWTALIHPVRTLQLMRYSSQVLKFQSPVAVVMASTAMASVPVS